MRVSSNRYSVLECIDESVLYADSAELAAGFLGYLDVVFVVALHVAQSGDFVLYIVLYAESTGKGQLFVSGHAFLLVQRNVAQLVVLVYRLAVELAILAVVSQSAIDG